MADYRIRIVVDPSGAESGSRRATTAVNRIGDAADRVSNRSVGGLMDKLRGLGGVLQVAAIVAGVSAYTRVADKVASMNAQLRLASRNQADLNRLQASSYQIAQRNGTAWDATGTLLAKTVKSARAMGHEMERAMQLGENATRAISAGIRVSGTNAQAAAAGVFQLGQALASGVLRGDELNSVMENIPGVADALARALGVTTGQLRTMGKEGELTSAKVIEGLEAAMPELERLAALIPLTFSGAFQKVQNSAAKLLTGLDSGGVGFGSALMKGMDLLSKGLDFLAEHVQEVSAAITGLLVAAAVKAAGSAIAAGGAALAQAKANDAVARSAVTAAAAQLAQARSSLQVAIAMNAQGAASAAQVRANAAAVTASAAQLASARGAALSTGAALGTAGKSATLFGRLMASAAGVARAALAAVGGPIGLIIAAVAGLLLYLGKLALGWQPIANEAGTVADYIAVAWEDMTAWISKKWSQFVKFASENLKGLAGAVRSVAVYVVDAFLGAARGAAGAVGGIVEAWRAGIGNIKGLLSGLASDAKNAMSGNFTTAGIQGAWGNQANLRAAFRQGYGNASGGAFSGVTGESVIGGVEDAIRAIPGAISDAFANSGYRDRANQRAADRARAQNTGGDAGPGCPAAMGGDDAASRARKAGADSARTFADILDEAKEAAKLATFTTNQAEQLSAVLGAQKELKRDLTESERLLLMGAVQQRQQNEANLRLQEEIRDVASETFANRVKSRAEDARAAGDYGMAIQLEAELRVQQMLNQAKRDGVTLDAAKVEAYRQAVILASRESEIIRMQEEARRALQQIADDARDSIRSAVSDGIYAALSGDVKGVGGFFKNLANIMRRQLAETITFNLFQKGQQAKVDNLRVTTQALQITAPAAAAVRAAGQDLALAISQAATAARTGGEVPVLAAQASESLVAGAPELDTALGGVIDVLQNAQGPLGGVIGGIIRVLSGIFGIGGAGGNAGGLLAGLFRKSEKAGSGAPDVGGLGKMDGLLGKLGKGAMLGQIGGMVPGLFGAKGSSTGGMIGGMVGNLIPGLGPIGGLIGGALGSLVGGLFKKTKYGTSVIGSSGGEATSGAAMGRGADQLKGAEAAGSGVRDVLNKYAQMLGGSVGSFGALSIGTYKDSYRVSTTGRTGKLKDKYSDVKDFGSDAQAALEYAVKVAIQRGALTGLSTGISNAIKSGLASVEEAADFLQTSKKIKLEALRLVDPVKAAVQEVDDEFAALKKQYEKFGESTVDLEKVYMDRRQSAIESALKDQMGSVRDFIAEIKGGAIGGASLVDRQAEQNRLFTAIEQAQASGQTVNYDELNTVGRALLDATRELEGATPAFYAQVDRVMSVLEAAIASGENPNVTALPPSIFQPEQVAEPIMGSIGQLNGDLSARLDALLAATNNVGKAVVRTGEPIMVGGSGGYRESNFLVANY